MDERQSCCLLLGFHRLVNRIENVYSLLDDLTQIIATEYFPPPRKETLKLYVVLSNWERVYDVHIILIFRSF